MNPKPFTILEAPSVLGLFPKGVQRLAGALLDAGLAERLDARRAGLVSPPPYDSRVDPDTKLLNGPGIEVYSSTLADAVGSVIDAGEFPVVLGGDCSILLGCGLAMRRRGRSGLLFLDGHADFYQPEAEPSGEVASMDLGFATGHGPSPLADLEGLGPLFQERDVAALGRRDEEETRREGSRRIEETDIETISLADVRRAGLVEATARMTGRLVGDDTSGFWVHLDADVLDDAVMPAVDYRQPGGLSWDELATVLRAASDTGRVHGIDITIFNPELDEDGAIAREFVETICRGLARLTE